MKAQAAVRFGRSVMVPSASSVRIMNGVNDAAPWNTTSRPSHTEKRMPDNPPP